jgi:hypothetical protein
MYVSDPDGDFITLQDNHPFKNAEIYDVLYYITDVLIFQQHNVIILKRGLVP